MIFTVFGKDVAAQIGLQSKLFNCCDAFKANGCLNTAIVCDSKTGETLADLQIKLSYSAEQLNCTCKCAGCGV